MRKNALFFLGAAAGICLALLVTAPQGGQWVAAAKAAAGAGADTYAQLNLFGEVFERVKADYVEKADDSKLIEGAINGMVTSLDPHSRYMNDKAWRDMQETTQGEFGWLGIETRLSSFNEQPPDGLKKAIADIGKEIPSDKLAGYVVDLRNNPGGLLDQAVSVTSAFMARGEVVSTRGRTPEETQRYTARGGDLAKGKPLVVLINGGSASASEIVAGALHDHKRATLIGTRSFGKGSVQTIIPLGTGNGALPLTTARSFTPSGHAIQALGIKPDIEVLQDVPDEFKTRSELTGDASS